jgi:HD-GYP domain-containing protein (c-di-GMP phosphodiesterase class II)
MSDFSQLDPGVEMALRLRRACEAHDNELGTHLDHVAFYACELARLAGLPEARIRELHYAAPLHDVGKIALPPALLNKPGALTNEEMTIVRSHTIVGHQILDGSRWPVMQCAARIALHHHENWDGSGYPNGLSGDAIPLEARIVAVADVFDALLSKRAYKPAWDENSVLTEMQRLRGSKFDPSLLELFLAHVPHVEIPAA